MCIALFIDVLLSVVFKLPKYPQVVPISGNCLNLQKASGLNLF